MPFGKYRGVELADLDDRYLGWLKGLDLREPLRSAVLAEFERRFITEKWSTPSSDVQTMALEIVSAGYRKLALDHHPDKGGSTTVMQLVNAAADHLRQLLRRTA